MKRWLLTVAYHALALGVSMSMGLLMLAAIYCVSADLGTAKMCAAAATLFTFTILSA